MQLCAQERTGYSWVLVVSSIVCPSNHQVISFFHLHTCSTHSPLTKVDHTKSHLVTAFWLKVHHLWMSTDFSIRWDVTLFGMATSELKDVIFSPHSTHTQCGEAGIRTSLKNFLSEKEQKGVHCSHSFF